MKRAIARAPMTQAIPPETTENRTEVRDATAPASRSPSLGVPPTFARVCGHNRARIELGPSSALPGDSGWVAGEGAGVKVIDTIGLVTVDGLAAPR